MGRLFGTDGVRGLANADITAELTLKLSRAAAVVLAERGDFAGRRPLAVVGRDSRISGEFLSAAAMAGLAGAGVDVLDAGVLPTPAIAYLTASTGADLGVMLSASHNPMPDNGIKFFSAGGHKLPDEVENAIENHLESTTRRVTGAEVGRITPAPEGGKRYVEHLIAAIPRTLEGIHLVIDAAHGAASEVGPLAFRIAGAQVTVIGAEPDGLNINDGYGSTHLQKLQDKVRETGADAGIAFDGDADRCLAVDAAGEIIDGDQIMAILALDFAERGALTDNTLVATVMSNLGMINAMKANGITVVQTAVGDRYVLEHMKNHGLNLGGEQSGHVISLDHVTTGDGILTGLLLASRMAATGHSLAELGAVMRRLPQVLLNVDNVNKDALEGNARIAAAVQRIETTLADTGRVLLRKSGTEPLVRVMIEAGTAAEAQSLAEELATIVRMELGQ